MDAVEQLSSRHSSSSVSRQSCLKRPQAGMGLLVGPLMGLELMGATIGVAAVGVAAVLPLPPWQAITNVSGLPCFVKELKRHCCHEHC